MEDRTPLDPEVREWIGLRAGVLRDERGERLVDVARAGAVRGDHTNLP